MITKEQLNNLKELYQNYTKGDPAFETERQHILIHSTSSLIEEIETLQTHYKEIEDRLDKIILLLDCDPTSH